MVRRFILAWPDSKAWDMPGEGWYQALLPMLHRADVSLHEDNRESTPASQDVGKGEAGQEL